MTLAQLIAALGEPQVNGPLSAEIRGLTADSRDASAGSLFVAVRGERADGHDFLAQAVAAGATAVVVEAANGAPLEGVTTVVVPDTRLALSRLAARFYGDPAGALKTVGITGTNGKTTTTYLAQAILNAAGVPAARIGTLGAQFRERVWPLENTTPLALELQRLLAEMRSAGARAVVMEVSSHALALERVSDVRFAIGVLTNVTRDHLDFHGTLEAYAKAKRSLFDRVETALLNVDDAYGRAWLADLRGKGVRCVGYGLAADADLRAQNVELQARGSTFEVDGQRFAIRLPARFNVLNALAALGIARGLGIADAISAAALRDFESVPGRMEHLSDGDIDVLVDYAHTPDALENVLRAARETARRRVIVVFGCGGDRDRGKRPQMGRIAGELADRVIVTSDNPRTEAPQDIVDEIVAGVTDPSRLLVELDRDLAIRHAIAQASRGDVVVVAGKGHETYQIVQHQMHHFDDREVVRSAFAQRADLAAKAQR